MGAAAHRRTRHRARVLGPVLSVVAVLLVTAPATWYTLRDDHVGVADRIPDVARTTARDDAARAASRGGPRPAATSNRDAAAGKTRTPPRTTSGTPSAKPTRSITARPSAAPSATPTQKPKPTKAPTTAPPPTTNPPPGGSAPSSYESEVVRLTNIERAKAGCGALTVDAALTKSAGAHASDMVDRHFFDHTNPDGLDPFERMGAAGFHGSAMAENIAMGYATPQAVMVGWMDSPGHRTNILNCKYNRIGVGYDPGQIKAGYVAGSWVQNFGTK